jgi:predicted transcriptional regulator
MEKLQKLFGGAAKVKVLRLFIFNPGITFDARSICEKARITSAETRREIAQLSSIGMIKKRLSKYKGTSYVLNEDFIYLPILKQMMTDSVIASRDDITRKISKACKLKALVFSGFFIDNGDTRADLLIVAQSVQKDVLKNTIKKIEAEVGKEIRYAVLDQGDFNYRQSIGDRLIRDILDYPHVVAYDRLGMVGMA